MTLSWKNHHDIYYLSISLQWRHDGHDSVSNHQPHDCFLNRLSRRRSMQTSKLRVTGLCAGNSPGTGEFLTQMASNVESVSIWWRHHVGECVIYVATFSITGGNPAQTPHRERILCSISVRVLRDAQINLFISYNISLASVLYYHASAL